MSKKTGNKSFFWASYADLMTSLFFVMLVLFIATVVVLQKSKKDVEDQLRISEAKNNQLKAINEAVQKLDSTYFMYEESYKKHKLLIDINFQKDTSRIESLPKEVTNELKLAGEALQSFVRNMTKENPNIQYLLIIEGQASRTGGHDHNYELSYRRAYNLKKYWEKENIKFEASNCEVIICGSGDGEQSGTGLMRESNEVRNQRFLIHVLPKPGYVTTE